MYFTLIPIGSRGDVQPFVALGCALKRAGHAVRVATHAPFADFVRSAGLEFYPLGGNPQQILSDLDSELTSKNPLKAVPAILEVLSQLIVPTLRGVVEVCQDSDAIIASYPALFAALEATEQQKKKLLLGFLHPATPSRYTSSLVFSPLPAWMPRALAQSYNRFSHWSLNELLFRMVRRRVDAARLSQLGWGPCPTAPNNTVHAQRMPILYAFSRVLMPVPPDWPPHTHVTGFWFLDSQPSWQPPPELEAFLNAPAKPIYIGFGTMSPQAGPVMRKLVSALGRRGQRAVIYAPDELPLPDSLPAQILRIGSTPHDWLFPRVSGVIHHGGVGTVAAALRAGVPSGTIAFSVEQSFWGRAVQRVGAGPQPLTVNGLSERTAERLLEAVGADRLLRDQAAQAGALIRAERGVEAAVSIIERELPHSSPTTWDSHGVS